MEMLFRKIEGNRGKEYSPAVTPTKTTFKGNWELRGLKCTIKNDGKQGTTTKGKGKGRGLSFVK